jgi:hypothetical protein
MVNSCRLLPVLPAQLASPLLLRTLAISTNPPLDCILLLASLDYTPRHVPQQLTHTTLSAFVSLNECVFTFFLTCHNPLSPFTPAHTTLLFLSSLRVPRHLLSAPAVPHNHLRHAHIRRLTLLLLPQQLDSVKQTRTHSAQQLNG